MKKRAMEEKFSSEGIELAKDSLVHRQEAGMRSNAVI